MTIEDIMDMNTKDLCNLMLKYPYDRLGYDGDTFVIRLSPNDDIDMNMFIPVPAAVVQEFYVRLFFGEHNDWTYNR